MNINEAREAIEEAAMCLTNGPGCHPYIEAWQDFNAAVRDFGLAVVEKAALLGGDHGVEVTVEYHALRKEIEELGK